MGSFRYYLFPIHLQRSLPPPQLPPGNFFRGARSMTGFDFLAGWFQKLHFKLWFKCMFPYFHHSTTLHISLAFPSWCSCRHFQEMGLWAILLGGQQILVCLLDLHFLVVGGQLQLVVVVSHCLAGLWFVWHGLSTSPPWHEWRIAGSRQMSLRRLLWHSC